MNIQEPEEQFEDISIEPEEEGASSFKPKTEASLKEQLKACEKERKEFLDGWQRVKADFVNAKKKNEERSKEMVEYGREDVLDQMFPVLDSFNMAFKDKEAWQKVDENWRKGVEYIHNQLLSVFESFDVEELDPTGEAFDPQIHTSVESIPTEEEPKDSRVSEVVQKGYRRGEKIIRSPKVKVFYYKK